jgi:hypothetical protein
MMWWCEWCDAIWQSETLRHHEESVEFRCPCCVCRRCRLERKARLTYWLMRIDESHFKYNRVRIWNGSLALEDCWVGVVFVRNELIEFSWLNKGLKHFINVLNVVMIMMTSYIGSYKPANNSDGIYMSPTSRLISDHKSLRCFGLQKRILVS